MPYEYKFHEELAVTHFERGQKIDNSPDYEVGTVSIRFEGPTNRLGEFVVQAWLPGTMQYGQGDTPKMWPEQQVFAPTETSALRIYGLIREQAIKAGWSIAVPGQ